MLGVCDVLVVQLLGAERGPHNLLPELNFVRGLDLSVASKDFPKLVLLMLKLLRGAERQ